VAREVTPPGSHSLQEEIRPGFTIDEPGSEGARARFLTERVTEAEEIRATEMRRRERKAAKVDREDVEPQLSNVEADEEEA
jgi:hypothetical protein